MAVASIPPPQHVVHAPAPCALQLAAGAVQVKGGLPARPDGLFHLPAHTAAGGQLLLQLSDAPAQGRVTLGHAAALLLQQRPAALLQAVQRPQALPSLPPATLHILQGPHGGLVVGPGGGRLPALLVQRLLPAAPYGLPDGGQTHSLQRVHVGLLLVQFRPQRPLPLPQGLLLPVQLRQHSLQPAPPGQLLPNLRQLPVQRLPVLHFIRLHSF